MNANEEKKQERDTAALANCAEGEEEDLVSTAAVCQVMLTVADTFS